MNTYYRGNLKEYIAELHRKVFAMSDPLDLSELEIGENYLVVPHHFLDLREKSVYEPKPSTHAGTSIYRSRVRYKFYDEKLSYYFDERLYRISWIALDLDNL